MRVCGVPSCEGFAREINHSRCVYCRNPWNGYTIQVEENRLYKHHYHNDKLVYRKWTPKRCENRELPVRCQICSKEFYLGTRVIDLNLNDLIESNRAFIDHKDILYVDGVETYSRLSIGDLTWAKARRLVVHSDISLCKNSLEIDDENIAAYVNYLGVMQAELHRRGVDISHESYVYWSKVRTIVMDYVKNSIDFDTRSGVILAKNIVISAIDTFDKEIHQKEQSWLTDILYFFAANINSGDLHGVEFYIDGIDYWEIDISKSPEMLALRSILIQISRGNSDYGKRLSEVYSNGTANPKVYETIELAKRQLNLDYELQIMFPFEKVTNKMINRNNLISLDMLAKKMDSEELRFTGSSTAYFEPYSKWNKPFLISGASIRLGYSNYSIDSVLEITNNRQINFKKVAKFLAGDSLFETKSVEMSESLSEYLQGASDLDFLSLEDFSFEVVTGRQIGKFGSKRTIAKLSLTDYSNLIASLPGGGLGFTEHIFSSNLIPAFKEFIQLNENIVLPSYRI